MSSTGSKLKTFYVREGDKYTLDELRLLLDCPEEEDRENLEIDKKIRRLKKFKAIQVINPKEDDENKGSDVDMSGPEREYGTDYGMVPDDKCRYSFTYVGVIVLDGRVILWCYPKYLLQGRESMAPEGLTSAEMRKVQDCLKLVMDVLKKHSRQNRKDRRQSPDDISRELLGKEETESANLGVMLYLLDDYYESGLYTSTEEIHEWNGSGEIVWDRTINDACAMVVGGKPYYMEMQTRRQVTDDMDYFLRLHKCVLTAVSREMNAGLMALFGYPSVDISEEELSSFGDVQYIRYSIERELNVQFNTRKQNVLKAMSLYIQGKHLQDNDHITMYGTNVFYQVWEDVCGAILGNRLDYSLSTQALGLEAPPGAPYDGRTKLIDVIEHPKWDGDEAAATLIPDIITITDGRFCIFDTKYYIPKLEKGSAPEGQPGIESVTKQYLYQLAYMPLIAYNRKRITGIKNAFIFPTEREDVRNAGDAVLGMLHDIRDDFKLENIQIIFLPAAAAYRHYLTGTPLKLADLKLR